MQGVVETIVKKKTELREVPSDAIKLEHTSEREVGRESIRIFLISIKKRRR